MNGLYNNSFSNFSSTTTTPYTQTTLTTTTSTISDKNEYEKALVNENNNEYLESSSLLQIQKLNEIEKKVGMLLKVASQAISILSGDEDENIESNFLPEDKENSNSKFEKLSTQYLELINDIQIGLRETFRFLTNTDIESSSYITNLPYICNAYGEEKDHEISVKILELVKTKINSILNSMGGSTIPLPISLSSSSIASASGTNFNMTTSLNNKFLNSRFSSNAELIASSLCSSNNNSNANIKVDDELANDIVMSKKTKIKKDEEELMDVDSTNEPLNIKLEKNNNEPIKSNNDAMSVSVINKEEDNNMKKEKLNNVDSVMNLEKDNNESGIPDLDLDF